LLEGQLFLLPKSFYYSYFFLFKVNMHLMKRVKLRGLETEILHYPRNGDSTVQDSTCGFINVF